jgi:hypothetical protein
MFPHLSGQFSPLSDQINTSNHVSNALVPELAENVPQLRFYNNDNGLDVTAQQHLTF